MKIVSGILILITPSSVSSMDGKGFNDECKTRRGKHDGRIGHWQNHDDHHQHSSIAVGSGTITGRLFCPENAAECDHHHC